MTLIGSTLSHFEIVSHIGGGGMGEVYAAIDRNLGRRVAIKVLPAEATRDASRITRFIQEAKAASALSHPGIVTVYEIGSDGGQHFIAMELVEGDTLRDRFARGGEPRSLIPIFAQVADGLEKAHSAGIVHRDLKPENVMVTPDGYAKILDFGLAKLVQADMSNPEAQTTAQHLTREGTVVGTMGYMSPEQLRGERVDHRTDVFALGCMIYEAFAGQQPFRGGSQVDTIHNVLHETPPPLRDAAVQRIVSKALAKRPEDRYASAREMATDLRAMTTHPARARVQPAIWIAAAIAMIVITAAFVIGRWRANARAPSLTSVVPLAGTSDVVDLAISPDAKYLAVVKRDGSLWVRQLATGSELQIDRGKPEQPQLQRVLGSIGEMVFSNDGNYLYFNEAYKLFAIPSLGGSRRFILDADRAITFSPDGKQFAFKRGISSFIANADGSHVRLLAAGDPLDAFGAMAWSPDGTWIAAVRRSTRGAVTSRIQRLRVDAPQSGTAYFPGEWTLVDTLAWTPDSGSVVAAVLPSYAALRTLIISKIGERRAEPLTNDLFQYERASIARDGTVAAIQNDLRWRITSVPLTDSAKAEDIADGGGAFPTLSTTPDGRVVYSSLTGAYLNLWVAGRSAPRQITSGSEDDYTPAVSPDGKTIVYSCQRGSAMTIWKVDIDGGTPVQLTFGTGVGYPSFSPDGREIIFTSWDGGSRRLMRMPASGGSPAVISNDYTVRASMSPDGSKIAALGEGFVIGILDAHTGKLLKGFTTTVNSDRLRWTSDGQAIAFNAANNIVLLPVDGSAPRALTHFDAGGIASFDWGPEQKSLICSRTTESRRVVLIRTGR